MRRLKYCAEIEARALSAFREGVLGWYRIYGRDLPWRKRRDPYAVVVSEIMLHQTTVTTVIPVYESFLERFPSIEALYEASLEDVKAITDPLGYKVRGKWLKDIAQAIVERYHGVWPRTAEDLMTLPGVGRYTAGAILSFAFGMNAPILDTNVKRVLGRYFGLPYREMRAEVQHHLWALADAVVPLGEAFDFNQALMDFGAMVCTARSPGCTICPMFQSCGDASGSLSDFHAAEAPSSYHIRPRDADETLAISTTPSRVR